MASSKPTSIMSMENLTAALDGAVVSSTASATAPPFKPFIKEKSKFYGNCPFDHLPNELNDRIFEYALVEEVVIPFGQAKEPEVLKVSHSLRNGLLPTFYAMNVFGIAVPHYEGTPTTHWVDDIEQRAKHMGLQKVKQVSKFRIILGIFSGEQQSGGQQNDSNPVHYDLVHSTLKRIFDDGVKIELVVGIEHPDPAQTHIIFRYPLGNPKGTMKSFKSMRDAHVDPEDCWLDLERVWEFDGTCMALYNAIKNMPEL